MEIETDGEGRPKDAVASELRERLGLETDISNFEITGGEDESC